jgi:hypothetical protein
MHPVNAPEVMLSDATHNVDINGNLTNEQTKQLISQLIEALVAFTAQFKCNQK